MSKRSSTEDTTPTTPAKAAKTAKAGPVDEYDIDSFPPLEAITILKEACKTNAKIADKNARLIRKREGEVMYCALEALMALDEAEQLQKEVNALKKEVDDLKTKLAGATQPAQ